MKKNRLFIVLALLLSLTLSACGASSADTADYTATEAAEEVAYEEYEEVEAEEAAAAVETAEGTSADGVISGETTGDLTEKIIYSASAEIETTAFDDSVDAVYSLMEQYGAFLETSSVAGNNISATYDGSVSQRTASFVLRVPKENYSSMTAALDSVGNVTYLTSEATNITSQYTDTESRLSAYETEEERLLEILAQATTVEDMIELESRLSEIRYQKESLTSQLQNWDNQVSYSTVSLNLIEVQELTPEPETEEPTYWEEVGSAFMNSLRWMGQAAKGCFKVLVAAIPLLLPIAIIILVVVLLCRSAKKRELRRREAKNAENQAERTPEPPEEPR